MEDGSFAHLTDGVITMHCLEPSDAEAHVDGEDDDQRRWLSGGTSTIEGVLDWISKNHEQWKAGGPRRHFGIYRNDGTLVGGAEANLATAGLGPGEVNVSYAVFPRFRGHGIAARAVRLICEWLGGNRLLTTAVIQVDAENKYSLRVPMAAGFNENGTIISPEGMSPEGHLRLRFDRPLRPRPIIREAREEDAHALAQVQVASWKLGYRGVLPDEYLDALNIDDRLPTWRERLAGGIPANERLMVSEDGDGRLGGFVATVIGDDSSPGEITQLYVHPEAWRSGHGRALTTAAVAALTSMNASCIELWVACDHVASRAFYEAMGFVDAGLERPGEGWGVQSVDRLYTLDVSIDVRL